MASQAVMGTKGAVSIDILPTDLQSLVNRWSGSLTRETADVTPFAPASNARKNLGGLYSMTGTADGFLDAAAIPDIATIFDLDAAAASLILTAFTGQTYTFNAVVTDFSPNVETGVPNAFTLAFVSDGPVTVAQVP